MAASPFNAVKLDIIVIGCFGVLTAAWLGRSGMSAAAQLAILAAYGGFGAFWVMVRVRLILKRHLQVQLSASGRETVVEEVARHGQD